VPEKKHKTQPRPGKSMKIEGCLKSNAIMHSHAFSGAEVLLMCQSIHLVQQGGDRVDNKKRQKA